MSDCFLHECKTTHIRSNKDFQVTMEMANKSFWKMKFLFSLTIGKYLYFLFAISLFRSKQISFDHFS